MTGLGAQTAAPATVEAVPVHLPLERLVPVALTAVVMVLALMTVTPWPVGAFQDDAIYTVLAKALATGEGYRMINLPGAPHATHFPPGYPFFLSLLWRLSPSFPENVVLFKFANAVWLSLAALGASAFCRVRLGWNPVPSALAAVAGTLAIVVLLVTGVVLSEPMFMALLFPALLLTERAAAGGSVRMALAAGMACGALALVRTLGAVIVPAALVVMIWRRQWRSAAAFATAAALCLVPWQLWLNAWQHEIPPVLMGKYGAYGPWMAQGYRDGGLAFARDVAVANLQSVDRFLGFVFMPVATAWPRAVAFMAASLLAVAGARVLVRRVPVTTLFLAAYAIVVMVWPFEPERFVLAVWPLLTICGLAGISAIWRWRPASPGPRGLRYLSITLAAAVVLGFAVYNARGYRHQWWASVQRDAGQRSKPIVEWVAAGTAPSDVLMTDDDLIVYLYTGRRGMPTSTFQPKERLRPPTDAENMAAVREMIDAYAPRYYITTSAPGQRAAEALTTGETALLRRHRLIPNAFIYARTTP
jgi:4-amino-4-deoxy-L-arabinose transferase-like glycosyltransferase